MSGSQDPPVVEGVTLGPFETNCYIVRVGSEGACWIVDAGWGPGALVERVRSLGLTPAAIILTHAHADHIAGLGEVKSAFPEAPILLHRAERAWLSDPELNLSAGFGEHITAPEADRLLDGGETLELDGSVWRVLHTPGHSPGGVTLHCAEAKLALVGDTLFAGSIGRFDFPTSDGQALFSSIRDTLYSMDDETRVYPGHGPETSIGREKRSNPFVHG